MDKLASQAIAAFTVIFAAGFAFAATISGVSGTIDQWETLTISGSNFGPAPNVVLFDDFELGTDGEDIMTGSGSARYGQWDEQRDTAIYSNITAVSGSLSFRAAAAPDPFGLIITYLPANTRDFFMSWWMYIPSGDNLPGEGTQDGTNWKVMWVLGDSTVDDDTYLPACLAIDTWVIGGNDSPYGTWPNIDFQKGEWKRVWVWEKGGYDNDGQCHFWELDSTNAVLQRVNDNNVTIMYSGGIREQVNVNGYNRVTQDCHPTFDDVYIAAGSNARARVEIGNDSTYEDCTGLAICVPTSWGSSSITGKVNIGGLDPLDDWYLFVIDAAGSASAGYHVAGLCTLTVTNGSGDGDYETGAVVGISADPPASGKLFATWIGDITHVADRYAADTTVTMPSADVSVTATYAWGYELTVNSGAGGGLYLFGTVVDIQADPAPSNHQFDQWTGDVSGMADVYSPSTTVMMPSSAAEITAVYEPIDIPGDLDGDLFVGQADLDIVLDNWGDSPPADPRADPSGDNFVGQDDLDIVLDHWGQSGP